MGAMNIFFSIKITFWLFY